MLSASVLSQAKLLDWILSSLLFYKGVKNTSLSRKQLQQLGSFVCDMKPETITDSDPAVLENLKECPDLTAAQRTALGGLLGSGNASYG